MKAIIFLGNSKDELKGFPVEARREAGFQLSVVQSGLDPSDWKPMPSVGAGVREIFLSQIFRIVPKLWLHSPNKQITGKT